MFFMGFCRFRTRHGSWMKDIFETIYFAACEASCELAQLQGSYQTYAGGDWVVMGGRGGFRKRCGKWGDESQIQFKISKGQWYHWYQSGSGTVYIIYLWKKVIFQMSGAGQAAQRARDSCSLTCGVLVVFPRGKLGQLGKTFSLVGHLGGIVRWSDIYTTQNNCQSSENAISTFGYPMEVPMEHHILGNRVGMVTHKSLVKKRLTVFGNPQNLL